jgi:hypothetical protein
LFKFGTKAETLERLRDLVRKSTVCPSVIISANNWIISQDSCIDLIQAGFPNDNIIIRSSSVNEDTDVSSMAGIHESHLNISSKNRQDLIQIVNDVVASYQRVNGKVDALDQVLVQPMITDVSMSGVVFTQDLDTGAPYYVINYDDQTGTTDAVTSGNNDLSRTLLIRNGEAKKIESIRFQALIMAVEELERVVGVPGLDIEFAVDANNRVWLFQLRRLAVKEKWNETIIPQHNKTVEEVQAFLKTRFEPMQGVFGQRSMFGVMPDWNPVEMIGYAPRPLAFSLYRYLITDSIWAEARAIMGYRDLSGHPLVVNLGGRPYVDVRDSYNSFLPASLPGSIGNKLVNAWLAQLEAHPEYHDKIEFEIVTSFLNFDFSENVVPSLQHVLDRDEIQTFKESLLSLTNDIVGNDKGYVPWAFQQIDRLRNKRKKTLEVIQSSEGSLLNAIVTLLNDCKLFGTKPFSVLARCAFISESMLRALNQMGLLPDDELQLFRTSVNTIISQFLKDVDDFQRGRIAQETFFQRYGHLRPGTYDITAERYDQQAFMAQFSNKANADRAETSNIQKYTLRPELASKIDKMLSDVGYAFDAKSLFDFMGKAIQGREYAKFYFSRNISDCLELMVQWGKYHNLKREHLSYLPVQSILAGFSQTGLSSEYPKLSKQLKIGHSITQSIRLPYLICRLSDVDVIPLLKSKPNYITKNKIRAGLVRLNCDQHTPERLKGRIAVIESADPGYDWIFMTEISGLITKFGGANSHMAIRCAELEIPAAIGCGEQIFNAVSQANSCLLDCGNEVLKPLV